MGGSCSQKSVEHVQSECDEQNVWTQSTDIHLKISDTPAGQKPLKKKTTTNFAISGAHF